MWTIEFFFLVFFVGLVVWGLWKSYRNYAQFEQKDETWERVADDLGLTFKHELLFSYPEISGKYRDRHLEVVSYVERQGLIFRRARRSIVTRATVQLRARWWANMTVSTHDIGDTIATVLGGDDVTTGHSALDSQFRIQGDPGEAEHRKLRSEDFQQLLMELGEDFEDVEIDDEGLQLKVERQLVEADELRDFLDRLIDAAEILDEESEEPTIAEAVDGDAESTESTTAEPAGIPDW